MEGGTTVTVHVDRTGTLAFLHVASLIGSVFVAAGGIALADQVAPVAGLAATVGGVGGILALGRAYWTSSTREIRERVHGLLDTIGEAAIRGSKLQ